jgi:Arc/MetJ-type ribon-helix-helix transcriptional regulator
MTVTLPPALAQFVEQRLRAGLYLSESEVVADALRMLIEGDHLRGGDLAGRLSVSLGRRPFTLSNLLGQLASVETEIKEIVHQLDRVKKQESENQVQVKEAQDSLGALIRSLEEAADAYGRILGAVSNLNN